MSKDKDTLQVPVPDISDESRDHSYRHSLQPKGVAEGPILRHTRSHNYGAKKKKVKVPPIPEVESEIKVEVINEQVKAGKKERRHRDSRGSRKSSQASSRLGIDNVAFELEDGTKISRGNSAASSVRSSMRDPSVQSLTVVREQYWCCGKWTPFERALLAAIGVLAVIIIILITVVAVMATKTGDKNGAKSLFFPYFN
ncbi:uncharacterized protein LOC135127978 isoform X2 [Zophobas morio]|uniref:uncharacterized protein LOC135127978 isoform X2 n=1 Tax=Zophobas morio TaxID=2755281 RepID=UPI003083E41E